MSGKRGGGVLLGRKCYLIRPIKVLNTNARTEIGSPVWNECKVERVVKAAPPAIVLIR